jgi:hypothetical protein
VLLGHWDALYHEVRTFRDACGDAHMKVILATGELATLSNVARASRVAMMAGADFIKTSTGKETANATMPVGLVMARMIRAYEAETGFAVGLELASPIARGVFITPELLYVQKGFGDTEGNTNFTMKISYIEVPVLIRADLGQGHTRPFVFGGGYLALKVGCSVAAESDQGSASATCVEAFNGDKLKSTDLGASVGAGVRFRHFGLSARYDLGFSNIPTDADPGTTVKNRSFLFLASFVVK